jgi:Domain of unknown function (DUF5666)
MTHSRRPCLFFVLVPVLAAAVGCGSEGSLTPTAPSATRTSRGAVIMGRVTGASTPAMAPAGEITTMATTTVTVTVVGTNISTVVDGTGQFTLTGVPPGDVRLKFSGSGVDATIMLTGVSATDRITITVSLNGGRARVESEERHDDDDEDEDDEDDDDNELEGAVSNLSGTCPTLTFTVQRTTVKTNGTTKFERPCSRIANGTRVEVEGRRQADGSILATEVD